VNIAEYLIESFRGIITDFYSTVLSYYCKCIKLKLIYVENNFMLLLVEMQHIILKLQFYKVIELNILYDTEHLKLGVWRKHCAHARIN